MIIASVEKLYNHDDRFFCYEVIDSSGQKHCVPHSEQNRHYLQILEWVDAGNTIVDNGKKV